jgi:hypothetical protein
MREADPSAMNAPEVIAITSTEIEMNFFMIWGEMNKKHGPNTGVRAFYFCFVVSFKLFFQIRQVFSYFLFSPLLIQKINWSFYLNFILNLDQ